MAYNPRRFRVERLNIEVSYHATWTFSGLKGVFGEGWAHGPIFGAFNEVGSGQVNITPASDQPDQRIVAVAGVRASGLLAEGPRWIPGASDLAVQWLSDVYSVLKPKHTVRVSLDLFGLYPLTNAERSSKALMERFYSDTFPSLFPEGAASRHAALDGFVPPTADRPGLSFVVGAVGPPHEGQFFAFPDADRDQRWWMGVRIGQRLDTPEGVDDPLSVAETMLASGHEHLTRIGTATLPHFVR